MSKKKIIIISVSAILVVFLLMFLLNSYSPLIMDDYNYTFGLNGRISSIKDILIYQKWFYLNWGGRNVAHFIAQFFLMNNKILFNVLNTIVFTAMVYLISSFANKKTKFDAMYFCLAFLGLWFLTPAYGQAFLWLTGSANYLWTSTIVLLFLKIFISIDIDKKQNIWKIIGISVLGLIAGWTNENTGAGLVAMLVVLLFIQYLEKKKINKTQILGLISNIAGFAIMILAPGNRVRSSGFIDNTFILIKWLKRAISISEEFAGYFAIPTIIVIILVSIYIYRKQKLDKKFYIFLTGIIVSAYSMVASPWFPTRSWTIVAIYFVILIGVLINGLNIKPNLIKFIFIDILIISAMIFAREYYSVFRESVTYYNIWENRRIEMEKGKKKGIYDFRFDGYWTTRKQCASFGIDDLYENEEDINSKLYARYFDVNSICLKKVEVSDETK